MLKDTRSRLIRILLIFVLGTLIVFTGLLLFRWTAAIEQNKQRRELSQALRTIKNEQGIQALLALSGVEVANIFYGEEGLILLEGNESSWLYSSDEKQNINVYENVNRSVVHITTTVDMMTPTFSDIIPAQGTGSGIILSSDGYILTNAHVVAKAASLKVGLYNNKTYPATLIGVDSEDDLAVIKIAVEKDVPLYPITLGTSEDLKIGQKVIAIGNPFGYDRTMTVGVVSGQIGRAHV